jgi:hypothetical protein
LFGAAALLLASAATAQQAPGGEAPPSSEPATHVDSCELHETWNGPVSQGPPIGA